MRFRVFTFLRLALAGSACSYEAKRKTETAVEQSVDKFHDQLNQQQYHHIYEQSDAELRSRMTEAEFTGQLLNAHEQMGAITSKASVHIEDSVGRAFRRALSGGWEKVNHGGFVFSDVVVARERFIWAVENDSPRLVSFELGKICRKPCQIVFGNGALRY
jgi:hypothetical protein